MIRLVVPTDLLNFEGQWIERSTGHTHKITGIDDNLPTANNRTIVHVESMSGVRKSMDLFTFISHYNPDIKSCERFVRCE